MAPRVLFQLGAGYRGGGKTPFGLSVWDVWRL